MVEWLSIKPAIGQAWFVLITIIVSYLGHKHFSFKTPGHNLITTSRQVPFRSLERHK
jgi:hypothetical protein